MSAIRPLSPKSSLTTQDVWAIRSQMFAVRFCLPNKRLENRSFRGVLCGGLPSEQGLRTCMRKETSQEKQHPFERQSILSTSACHVLYNPDCSLCMVSPSSAAARLRPHQLHGCRSSAASDSCTLVYCERHASTRPSRTDPSRMLVQAATRATTCCAWQCLAKLAEKVFAALWPSTGCSGVGRETQQRERNLPRKDLHPHGLNLLVSYTFTIFRESTQLVRGVSQLAPSVLGCSSSPCAPTARWSIFSRLQFLPTCNCRLQTSPRTSYPPVSSFIVK